MLVDFGRVCNWGTVFVDKLVTIEQYGRVMHLVSKVKGSLRCDRTAIDLIRALFSGGTIAGCPKVRCMEMSEYCLEVGAGIVANSNSERE